MKKKKIQSKEKHFFEYLEKLCPVYGVIGKNGYLDKSVSPPKFIKPARKFLILDKNFKVIFENTPYNNMGNFHSKVVAKMKEMGLKGRGDDDNIEDDVDDNIEDDNENLSWEKGPRTDDSVEELISNLVTTASLNWFSNFHSDEVDENFWPKKLPEESLDVEPSSKEFEEFERMCDFSHNVFKKHSESRLDTMDIEYETFTEKGKEKIDECIEWFKTNKSKTPIQDAWFKVLEKNGIKVDWKPFDKWCEVNEMRKVDYSSKEEIDERRKKEDEERRKKITPAQREEFRRIAEQMKNK